MADHHREGAPFAAEEDRHEHEDVGQMHAAMIGIVHDDDVAVVQIALELRQHRGHRLRDRAEMLGDGLGLRHHLAVAGAQRRREIHHVLDDLGARDADHRVGHVVGDRIEPALDDRKGDRIDLHASNSRTMQPIASLCDPGVRRHHDGGVEFLDDQRPWRGVAPSAPRSTISTATCRLAARKGDLPRAGSADAPARAAIFMLPKVEAVVAQATAGDAHLHQFDRRVRRGSRRS